MFKLKVFLPSLQKHIFVKELSYKFYRDLVKSLYVEDEIKTVEQFNLVLEEIAPEIISSGATLLDKLAVFLQIREICVSPDLTLNCTCTTDRPFEYKVNLSETRELLNTIPTSLKITYKEIKLEINTFLKVSDEIILNKNFGEKEILASKINKIKILQNTIDVNNFSLQEKINLINNLPHNYLNYILPLVQNHYKELNKINLIEIKSPFNGSVIYKLTGGMTAKELNEFLNLLYTEDLNNVYRAFYNMVKHCKFSPEYVDRISPAELQVYWSYWAEENNKKENTNSASSGILPMPSSQSAEFGF